MKKNHTLLSFTSALLVSASLTAVLIACGDDDVAVTNKPDSGASSSGGSSGASSGSTSSSGDSSTKPNPPALGAEVDRMGRPAINTATNNTFTESDTTAGTKKDAYNADKDKSAWVTNYRADIGASLAILDSIDGNCGNQLLAKADGGTNVDRYGTLAGVLADDRLWLNTAGTTATQYLAVELNATAIAPNTDQGGRTLKYDVIETTYSAVAIGAATGFDDGITRDTTKTDGTAFPFLAAP